jgi:hypothetical protein
VPARDFTTFRTGPAAVPPVVRKVETPMMRQGNGIRMEVAAIAPPAEVPVRVREVPMRSICFACPTAE